MIRKLTRTLRSSTTNALASLKGSLSGNRMTAFWYDGTVNFGDLITPLLLRHYGMTPVHASAERAQVIATGSILHMAPEDFAGQIVGSGLMRDEPRRYSNARFRAVRGRLTRTALGLDDSVPLGDPGMLCSRLLPTRSEKQFTLGLIPHYVDKADPRIARLHEMYPDSVTIIDVKRQPMEVFRDVDACEHILSSSLHGVITADSLGIPAGWMRLSDKVSGGAFKFNDYCSAFDAEITPIGLTGDEALDKLLARTRLAPQDKLESLKDGLEAIFNTLREELLSA